MSSPTLKKEESLYVYIKFKFALWDGPQGAPQFNLWMKGVMDGFGPKIMDRLSYAKKLTPAVAARLSRASLGLIDGFLVGLGHIF